MVILMFRMNSARDPNRAPAIAWLKPEHRPTSASEKFEPRLAIRPTALFSSCSSEAARRSCWVRFDLVVIAGRFGG